MEAQVASRMRGGGKHKDKKSTAEKKQAASPQRSEQKSYEEPKSNTGLAIKGCDKEAMIRLMEENEDNRKINGSMSDGSDVQMDRTWDRGEVEMMECGLRWAVGARRKRKRDREGANGRTGARQESAFQSQRRCKCRARTNRT